MTARAHVRRKLPCACSFSEAGEGADEVSAEFWAGEPKNERAKEVKAALGAARLGGKNKIYAESFTAGSCTKSAKDDWSFASLKPYADKFFRKGVNATVLHVVISQPGDETEPPVRPWFGTFFDRRSRNAAEMKKLVPYLRRCNFMLQQGRPADVAPIRASFPTARASALRSNRFSKSFSPTAEPKRGIPFPVKLGYKFHSTRLGIYRGGGVW